MKLVETSLGFLFIGDKDDILMLVEKKPKIIFDVIWNLAEELEFLLADEKYYAQEVLAAKIDDYSVPNSRTEFNTQLTSVVEILRVGGKALIHCFGGHGRTGMGLAAIKMKLDGFTAPDALAFADVHCSGPENEEQKQFIISLGHIGYSDETDYQFYC